MKRTLLFLISFTFFCLLKAQQPVIDSLHWVDQNPLKQTQWQTNPDVAIGSSVFVKQVLAHHPYFGFNTAPSLKPSPSIRNVKGKETFFYIIVLLLIVFGLLRQLFPKYFNDLFRLFFKTTLKQKQVREQLLQTTLPSLTLNIFFIISTAIYIALLSKHFQSVSDEDFWITALYAALALAAVYTVKYVGIVLSGWLFGIKEVANAYVFVVFIVNKMIGIFLIPFIVLLAFSKDNVYSAGITLSWCVLGALYIYRAMLTWSAARSEIRVNPLHFFLYLLAFEVAPLLVIYKALLLYFT